jgi:hypothetical protein
MTNPVVIGPTMDMASRACTSMGINPRKHAVSGNEPNRLRGLGPDSVVLFLDVPAWDPLKLRDVEAHLDLIGGTVCRLRDW